MKKAIEQLILSVFLILLSIILYSIHFIYFKDLHHILIYLVGDIAFLPLEILFVSFIFHKTLEYREKKNTFKKLNMVVGAFFSESGTKLLELFADSDLNIKELQSKLIIKNNWGNKDFKLALNFIEKYNIKIGRLDLVELKLFLKEKREFMLKIIENPALLEHELFSELMMAIFHLEEELSNRIDVLNLRKNDEEHIYLDIQRAYKLLIREWVLYIQHLKSDYPYLFSFAIRTNPFDKNSKVEIS
jgi:hypothetical protein